MGSFLRIVNKCDKRVYATKLAQNIISLLQTINICLLEKCRHCLILLEKLLIRKTSIKRKLWYGKSNNNIGKYCQVGEMKWWKLWSFFLQNIISEFFLHRWPMVLDYNTYPDGDSISQWVKPLLMETSESLTDCLPSQCRKSGVL